MAKGWATQFPNGSWMGMAQQIMDGEADISLAKISMTQKRANYLQYLIPTHGQRFVTKSLLPLFIQSCLKSVLTFQDKRIFCPATLYELHNFANSAHN